MNCATDYESLAVVPVKKLIWSDEDQAFRTYRFTRVQCESLEQCHETIVWCQEQFGNQCYLGSWWQDHINTLQVWLSDTVATFWQLKYGDPA